MFRSKVQLIFLGLTLRVVLLLLSVVVAVVELKVKHLLNHLRTSNCIGQVPAGKCNAAGML